MPAVNPPARPDFNISVKFRRPVVMSWTPVFIAIEIREPLINPAVNVPATSAKAPLPKASVTYAPALAAKPPSENPLPAAAPVSAAAPATAPVPPVAVVAAVPVVAPMELTKPPIALIPAPTSVIAVPAIINGALSA